MTTANDGAEDAGAYYTAKLTFFHDFPIKFWDAYCTNVRIIFKFLRYLECLLCFTYKT